MKAYLFPGQGSQIKGMGMDLFDKFPDITAKASDILGYAIKTLCLEDPDKVLNKTQYTQPALYVVNALSYLQKLQHDPTPPDFVAGHSLGEYNALFAADMIDFETGLRLVKKRGELMSQAFGGGMAAILNCDYDKIRSILEDNNLLGIDVANFNSPKQIVLSGPSDEIEIANSIFTKKDIIFIPLNVSAAFHSRYMQAASNEFGNFLNDITFLAPKIPVLANLTARPYQLADTKNNLTKQITSSVKWTDTIYYLLKNGITTFEEVGPSNVLTKLVKVIQSLY